MALPPSDQIERVLREVRRIELQTRQLSLDALVGGYRSAFRGAGVEFEEVREYVEGDDPRSVDWNVTARVGRPFIKKYVDERALSVIFTLDISASMDAGFGAYSAREAAVRFCAGVGLSALRNHDRIGFLGFSDRVERWRPPAKGMDAWQRLVREGLILRASSSGADASAALALLNRVPARGALVFILSDFGGVELPSVPMMQLAHRHEVILVRLVPPEAAGLSGPLFALRSPESGDSISFDARSPVMQARYQEAMTEERRKLRVLAAQSGADLLELVIPRSPSPELLLRPVLQFFQTRRARLAVAP